MSSATPKKPDPKVINAGKQPRIIPFADSKNLSEDDIHEMQKEALQRVEELKSKILNGKMLGVAYACVELHEGDACICYGWSDGAMFEGMATHTAIAHLQRQFQTEWENQAEEVDTQNV